MFQYFLNEARGNTFKNVKFVPIGERFPTLQQFYGPSLLGHSSVALAYCFSIGPTFCYFSVPFASISLVISIVKASTFVASEFVVISVKVSISVVSEFVVIFVKVSISVVSVFEVELSVNKI
jgi:hypothetical protein